jgi:hypothetical protein
MSIHSDILYAATKILGDSADVYIEQEGAASTELRAIARQTGYTESKTVVHGLGYLADSRTWAKSLLEKIATQASSPQAHV